MHRCGQEMNLIISWPKSELWMATKDFFALEIRNGAMTENGGSKSLSTSSKSDDANESMGPCKREPIRFKLRKYF